MTVGWLSIDLSHSLAATKGVDYEAVNQTLTFEVSQILLIHLLVVCPGTTPLT